MTRYVALLRGINVSGKNKVAMTDLRALFEAAGMRDVATLLQSGNVVFESPDDPEHLEGLLQARSESHLKLRVDYFVRDSRQWRAIIQDNPFPDQAKADPARLVVTCLKTAPGPEATKALAAAVPGPEMLHLKGRELYAYYPDGIGNSKLDAALVDRKLKVSGTARNWNTVLKIDALLRQPMA